MEMTSANCSVEQAQTAALSLLSLRHITNVIPTFNKRRALAAGITLIVSGFLSVIFVIVIVTHVSPYSSIPSADYLHYLGKLWYPYMVSE